MPISWSRWWRSRRRRTAIRALLRAGSTRCSAEGVPWAAVGYWEGGLAASTSTTARRVWAGDALDEPFHPDGVVALPDEGDHLPGAIFGVAGVELGPSMVRGGDGKDQPFLGRLDVVEGVAGDAILGRGGGGPPGEDEGEDGGEGDGPGTANGGVPGHPPAPRLPLLPRRREPLQDGPAGLGARRGAGRDGNGGLGGPQEGSQLGGVDRIGRQALLHPRALGEALQGIAEDVVEGLVGPSYSLGAASCWRGARARRRARKAEC